MNILPSVFVIRYVAVMLTYALVAYMTYVGYAEHEVFPYWFEHALVAGTFTTALALVFSLFVQFFTKDISRNTFSLKPLGRRVTKKEADVIMAIAITFGFVFYLGREVRDNEKLGGWDVPGLAGPIVIELLILLLYVAYIRSELKMSGTTISQAHQVALTIPFVWLFIMICTKMGTVMKEDKYKDARFIYIWTLLTLAFGIIYSGAKLRMKRQRVGVVTEEGIAFNMDNTAMLG